jgi:3D (Asp-Asp-Asp) domain-containing protein
MTSPPEPSRSADEVEPELARAPGPGPASRGLLGLLSDLLGRIVRGIKGMAPLVFAVGCQSTATEPTPRPAPEPAADVVADEPVVIPVPDPGPRPLGAFNITFYYVVGEDEMLARSNRKKAPANENLAAAGSAGSAGSGSVGAEGGTELAAATQPEMVTLYGPTAACEPIAETTREFAYELTIQGTGKLRDGRVVNVWGPCNCPRSPCWRVTEQHWGMAGTGRALLPFRTVAVDPKLVKLGSLLHIPLLEGRTMPGRPPRGGYVHDGCVVADDTGGAIRGRQIDLFVGRKGWVLGMSGRPGAHSWARQVPVFDGSKICERKGRRVSRKAGAI